MRLSMASDRTPANHGVMYSVSGKRINLDKFTWSMVDINDIALALARQCRFNGHINRHFSVAEHSIVGSHIATGRVLQMEALLHDAAEAYVGDVILPLKEVFPQIEVIEAEIAGTIFKALWPYDRETAPVVNGRYVKTPAMSELDRYMGNCEIKQFHVNHPLATDETYVTDLQKQVWQSTWFRLLQSNHEVKMQDAFVDRYLELGGRRLA